MQASGADDLWGHDPRDRTGTTRDGDCRSSAEHAGRSPDTAAVGSRESVQALKARAPAAITEISVIRRGV
jgi:hypothetical protein